MSMEIQKNTAAAIQSLLYNNPLYDWIPEGEVNLNVMTVGCDPYAEKFIDLCLQAGQMTGHKLCITVIAENPAQAREQYLKNRPAIPEFVDVNGSLTESGKEIYAVLNFKEIPGKARIFDRKSPAAEQRPVIEEILLERLEQEHIHYIFLSVGDDEYNRDLAGLFSETAMILDNRCSVNYVVKSATEADAAATAQAASMLCHPVHVCAPLPKGPGNETLERMAFNTHIIWKGNQNIDMQKAWEEFQQPYYYEASMAFALSIPYKLQSFGITGTNAEETAGAFCNRILAKTEDSSGYHRTFWQLAVLEHRRWLLQKITEGWQAPPSENGNTDYSYCIENAGIRDEIRKFHPCIVRSTAETPLKSRLYTKDSRRRWDVPGPEDDLLDELDRMSLMLHRRFRSYTASYRSSDPVDQGEPARLGQLLQNAPEEILRKYRRFYLCLKNVLDGDEGYSIQYPSCEKNLSDAVLDTQDMGSEEKEAALSCIRTIRHDFFPVIEYNLFRNYKELDEELIRNIPFILTYRRPRHMAMALELAADRYGSSDIVFRNVASATVIQPMQITYVYCFDRYSDLGLLRRKILALANYYRWRNMDPALNFAIAFLQNSDQSEDIRRERHRDLASALSRLQDKELRGQIHTCILDCPDEEGAVMQLTAFLQQKGTDLFDGTNPLFLSQRCNARFTQQAAGHFPYFEFDSTGKCFLHDSRCPYLHYIDEKSYISVEDMFALMNAENRTFHYPDYAMEYMDLWEIYTGDSIGLPFHQAVGCWNILCGLLNDYQKGHNSLHVEKLRLRDYSMGQFEKLLRGLEQKGFVRSLSLSRSEKEVSFDYQSDKIRSLLTKAGEILEVYVYFEACRTGYFDDVVSGYEFQWEAGGVANELDCVLMKGFRSIIVECKARPDLSQDFYYKLDSLAGRFAVGTKKVLIANIYRNDPRWRQVNEMQKTRGRLMDITTLYEESDIRNIRKKLQEIMEKP